MATATLIMIDLESGRHVRRYRGGGGGGGGSVIITIIYMAICTDCDILLVSSYFG